jgi:hypothetical protein
MESVNTYNICGEYADGLPHATGIAGAVLFITQSSIFTSFLFIP